MTDPNQAVAPITIGGTPRDYSATAMIKRLLVEEALPHWSRVARAFLLMGISAGRQSMVAYLVGDIINAAYVSRSFESIVWL